MPRCVKEEWPNNMGLVRKAVKVEPLINLVPIRSVKLECVQHMKSLKSAVKDEPLIDLLPMTCVKLECSQGVKSLKSAVKDEPLIDLLPMTCVKLECSQGVESVRGSVVDDLSTDVILEQEIMQTYEHNMACARADVPSINVILEQEIKQTCEHNMKFHNCTICFKDCATGTVMDDPSTDVILEQEIMQTCERNMEPVWSAIEQESPAETSLVHNMKQEILKDLVGYDFSFKMEPKDEITVEDHCIFLREGSNDGVNWSSDEDEMDPDTCITSDFPSQWSLFSSTLAQYCNPESSLIEDYNTEGVSKTDKATVCQQSVDELATLTPLSMDNNIEINSFPPDAVSWHTVTEADSCVGCEKPSEQHEHTCNLKIQLLERDIKCQESVSSAVKDEAVINTLPIECVKVECSHDMGCARSPVMDDPLKDVIPDQRMKQTCPNDMESIWIAVKQESPPETLPVHSVKKETPEDLEEPDVQYNMLSLKMELKNEVTVEDHCVSFGKESNEVSAWSSDGDMSDSRFCVTPKVTPELSLFSTRMSDYYNPGSSLMETFNGEGREMATVSQTFEENNASCLAVNIHNCIKRDCVLPMNISGLTIKEFDDKCKECGKYSELHEVTCSFNIMSDGKVHNCGECGECFNDSGELRQHVKNQLGMKDHKCVVCGKCFIYACTLRNHVNIHSGVKKYKCIECGKCFTELKYLTWHLKIHYGEKNHKCTECGKCFTHGSTLTKHLKLHFGEKVYKCSECGKSFAYIGNLRKHLKIHSGERDHKCVECGKSFTHGSTLRNHLKIHSGEKEFKCTECGKCFIQFSSLRSHLKMHSRKKDHECTECGKCFTHDSTLRKHLNIHSNERDYKCTLCEKHFTHRSNLSRHKKSHSGVKDYKCTVCGKCFTRISTLKQHLKNH